ncbi:lycopene cyclase domain-containing protein [Coleofasciculus sp. FACHB-SPT36]|uniref:lycopene cyclase domain-containing protein n=1 Tax=Cyanophyceae TaxID=3028117 RepID=UPI00168A9423|nr:lycopene cyclase domain-containing protein [Coleofasciculus sp. FACHB-SPT36]MBD2540700.1 lycopene cyclase domain-containing protein [Coleofasciculus sp. FACHB-SPT36]
MSYFAFHLVFILPPILFLAWVQRQPLAGIGGLRAWLGLPLIALIALIYTTPWDNYLVWHDVWNYGTDRVVGTIGYVPVEEYLFFILQPLLTGLWLYWLFPRTTEPAQEEDSPWLRASGIVFWLVLSIAGAFMLQSDKTVYMGLILAWAGPVLALQWGVGAKQLWARKDAWLIGTLIPTVYLWIADRIAIGQGIWSISETYSIGFKPFGLPIEEATFFLITNLLVVQGLLLFLLVGKMRSLLPLISFPILNNGRPELPKALAPVEPGNDTV